MAFEMATTVADIQGMVECHYPCVPECSRDHEWEDKN